MVTAAKSQDGAIRELTLAEARDLIEQRVRGRLQLDGVDEFIRRWESGYYGEPDDNPDALEIAALLPMIGVDPWRNGRHA